MEITHRQILKFRIKEDIEERVARIAIRIQSDNRPQSGRETRTPEIGRIIEVTILNCRCSRGCAAEIYPFSDGECDNGTIESWRRIIAEHSTTEVTCVVLGHQAMNDEVAVIRSVDAIDPATPPTASEPKPRTNLRRQGLIGCTCLEWRIPRIELISNANVMACSGQVASHLRQPMHLMGEFLIRDCPIGQAAEQVSHLVQESPTRR